LLRLAAADGDDEHERGRQCTDDRADRVRTVNLADEPLRRSCRRRSTAAQRDGQPRPQQRRGQHDRGDAEQVELQHARAVAGSVTSIGQYAANASVYAAAAIAPHSAS
jgi:hypothetical protein